MIFRYFIGCFILLSSNLTLCAQLDETKAPQPEVESTNPGNLTTVAANVSNRSTEGTSKITAKWTERRQALQASQQQKSQLSTQILEQWNPTGFGVSYIEDLLQSNIGASFYDARIRNYTHVVFLPKQSAIYVVGNGVAIFKMDMISFFLLDSFTLPESKTPTTGCQDTWSCRSVTEISLLARMPNEQMIWYCYIHQYEFSNKPPQHIQSGCMVPQLGNLGEPLVQWENPHFNSLDPRHPASILNADDGFTYISAFTPDYTRIFRTRMPDWNGQVNWTGTMVTDKSPVYIVEPATILLTFETENEVYFVLREQSVRPDYSHRAGGQPRSKNQSLKPNRSSVARLVRVCKGDRGGLPHVSENTFGTFAKSDLLCQASDTDGGHFTYTQISVAYWDNSTLRLFAVFTSEKWAPMGSALCVYGKPEIEMSFNGPLMNSNQADTGRIPVSIPNSFSNMCERFNSNNLTMEELFVGRRMSLSFPNRFNPVEPINKRAIIIQTGVMWIHLQAYNLPALPTHYHFGSPATTTVVFLGTKNALTRIAIYEPTERNLLDWNKQQTVVCKLNELRLGQALNILIPSAPVVDHNGRSYILNYRSGRTGQLSRHYWRTALRKYNRVTSGDMEEEIRHINILSSRLFVITNHQVLWLPLAECSYYTSFDQCLGSRDPHCGWSWHEAQCVNGYDITPSLATNWFNTFSPSVDRRRVDNVKCPSGKHSDVRKDKSWSEWYACRLVSTGMETLAAKDGATPSNQATERVDGVCQCRICLSQENCLFGTQEVINCTRFERDWDQWSTWSPCNVKSGMEMRQRTCSPNAVCNGASQEQRPCSAKFQWPTQFQSIPGDLTGYTKNTNSPQVPTQFVVEGFSVAFLMLIAFCCLFIGCFVPTVIFYLCPNPCTKLEGNYNWLHPTNGCKNVCSCRQKGHHSPKITSTAHSVDTWSMPDPNEDCWTGRHSHLNAIPPKQAKLGYQCNNPAHLIPRRHKSTRPVRANINPNGILTSSMQQLLSGTPLPSPTSVLSGPSTASTILKDNFTFENLSDQTYDIQEELASTHMPNHHNVPPPSHSCEQSCETTDSSKSTEHSMNEPVQ